MGNFFSADSYLHQHGCSARNLTWQYIRYGDLSDGLHANSVSFSHNNSTFNYALCPYAKEILLAHNCKDHSCLPNWFDREFKRYSHNNWEGLGDPWVGDGELGWWRNHENPGLDGAMAGKQAFMAGRSRLYWPVLMVGWSSKCPKQLDGTEPESCEYDKLLRKEKKQTKQKE